MNIVSGPSFGIRDIHTNKKIGLGTTTPSMSVPAVSLTPAKDTFHFSGNQIATPEPSATATTPRTKADPNFIKYLNENNIDINRTNENGENVLMIAAEKGMSNVAGMLLDAGCHIDQTDIKGQTAIMKAAAKGHEDIVQRIITVLPDAESAKALINHPDHQGETAASLAYKNGHLRVVILLMKHGADLANIKFKPPSKL